MELPFTEMGRLWKELSWREKEGFGFGCVKFEISFTQNQMSRKRCKDELEFREIQAEIWKLPE